MLISFQIGAWKCNFSPFSEIMTDGPTVLFSNKTYSAIVIRLFFRCLNLCIYQGLSTMLETTNLEVVSGHLN